VRVEHIITRLIVGGAQENTLSTVLGLHDIPGVEVQLVSGPTTGPEGTLEPQARAVEGLFHLEPHLVRPVSPWHDFRALFSLAQRFRKTRPDIVHTHSGKAGLVGRLAARMARVPCVIHTIHGPSFGDFQGRGANFLFKNAERLAGRFTHHFIVVANAMRDQYLRAGIGSPELYSRVFSGFNLKPYLEARNDLNLRAKYGIRPEDVVIGKIARLFYLKGHDDLFAVAPRLIESEPRLKFLLVGDGILRGEFEEKLSSLGIRDHFVFTGLVPPSQIPALTGIMDSLIHLSRREGLPRALPQALAAGKPVVAFDCDGAREVCISGETGFLIPPGDLGQLSSSLRALLKEGDLRCRLGSQGRDFVKERFSEEKMVSDIYRLYQNLLKPPARQI
jgi:glycosyltransferase involved in cell wall biosynthesis